MCPGARCTLFGIVLYWVRYDCVLCATSGASIFDGVCCRLGAGHLAWSRVMAKEQRSSGTGRGLGPQASRRGLLQAGLAIGTLALGQRAALGQPGHAHAHMPELGVANLPVVPTMDQPLVEPEVRRSANGVLSTSLRCAYAYRDIGGFRLYTCAVTKAGSARRCA